MLRCRQISLQERIKRVCGMKEQNRNKRKDAIAFIESLTEEELEKIISRIDEIKELLVENQ